MFTILWGYWKLETTSQRLSKSKGLCNNYQEGG